MEKFFTFNKFFIGFCALLVVIVFASNYARDERIKEQAKVIGQQAGEWNWPAQGVSTTIDDISAKIIKLSENDAEVEVHGKQKVAFSNATEAASVAGEKTTSDAPSKSPDTADYKAVLTLYKNGKSPIWLLGKLEEQ
jgi:hypothetical protein